MEQVSRIIYFFIVLVRVKMKVNKSTIIQVQHKVDYILEIDAFFNTHNFDCKIQASIT